MTGDADKFIALRSKDGGKVTSGGNQSGKITGTGEIGAKNGPQIKDVYLVEGLCHNLLSVSQSADKNNWIIFDSEECLIINKDDLPIDKGKLKVLFKAPREGNCYTLDLPKLNSEKCFVSNSDESWLWHKRLAHVNMHQLDKLLRKDLVVGLPKINFKNNMICESCQRGKQTKSSFKKKPEISTNRPLQLLHMDLVGPARVKSLGGNLYTLVIVDDFSRFTWTIFLSSKDETFDLFVVFANKVQNEKGICIVAIRTDHGGEFENQAFEEFCNTHGIDHNFSAPRTPQQNGVVERKNRVLTEMARAMLNENQTSQVFWADAMSTACYISNRAYLRKKLNKTPYELYKGRKPNLTHLHIFGCKCFAHNNGKDNLGKFDPKSDEGIFIGYSNRSKAYRIFDKRTRLVEESIHVVFCESKINGSLDDDDEVNNFKNQFFSKSTPASIQNSKDIFETDSQNNLENPDQS